MHIIHRHDWNVTPAQAVALQNQLAGEVIEDQPLNIDAIKLVAGVDVSVKNDVSQAAIVVITFPDFKPVEVVRYQLPTPFPYIPGLLTFREGPVLEEAFKQLHHEPDVFIFDGMGRIHPRRMGIASHMGLWLDRPTIGCGKSYFVGKLIDPPQQRGAYTPLMHRGDLIGVTLRTRANVQPVFISVGHRCDLASAVQVIMHCTTKYRLPEPIRMAHQSAQINAS